MATIEAYTPKIVRNNNGVKITIDTTLDPGAYTIWLLVWNDPENLCMGDENLQCNPEANPNTDFPECVIFGTGHVGGNNGTGHFAATLKTWDTSDLLVGPRGCENGLTNPRGAAVHALIRSHGSKLPGQVNTQISTVGGGCMDNMCEDVQATPHEVH